MNETDNFVFSLLLLTLIVILSGLLVYIVIYVIVTKYCCCCYLLALRGKLSRFSKMLSNPFRQSEPSDCIGTYSSQNTFNVDDQVRIRSDELPTFEECLAEEVPPPTYDETLNCKISYL